MFFSKAYKILEQMSIFNHQSTKSRSSEYIHDDLYEREIHDTISQNKDNNKFNSIFEKINSDMLPSNKNGYGDWLSDTTTPISINTHDKIFEQYKKIIANFVTKFERTARPICDARGRPPKGR